MASVVGFEQQRFKAFKTELPGVIQLRPMAYLTTRVKALREAKQRTQQELAAESGVSVTTISRYENERVTMFSAKVLERLSQALDVQPGLLLVRVE
jgi:DNA-binding Xre family transcriptional regulator